MPCKTMCKNYLSTFENEKTTVYRIGNYANIIFK
ncbi:hypothetical protein SAMN05216446_1321 [Parafannyhessea umbonata]|uniref:Uncharacterized protein n=1 Tax=Parafannyhessea umbonata TaxID=604330 RepID=A0A1H9Q5A4_9ACTN|nr:hypothetical protein SAMN05216447_1103 [Parafannyhessea umbonata]SER55736.1 hypothetical protein SAMN05216446_1321 [Parafannyhessea umbonata]